MQSVDDAFPELTGKITRSTKGTYLSGMERKALLKDKILKKSPGILTYGMTPPKLSSTQQDLASISIKQYERLKQLDIDGLILYDIQEESDRIAQERPYPYIPTIDPTTYANEYLWQLNVPKIIYRCVGKYSSHELTEWIENDSDRDRYSVFVGASSRHQEVKLKLSDAYELAKHGNPNLLLGGVMIPERHTRTNDEHLRIVSKMKQGCRFFVSQATYNVEATKNLLSDYFYYCMDNELQFVPLLINLSPCGSQKTLEFMKWLGISIPRWLENDLIHSKESLEKSVTLLRELFEEIFDFGLEKGIPVGCSVESVSTRRVEIEASIQLVRDLQSFIEKKLVPIA